MTKLKDLFESIHVSVELSTADELKDACALIMQVQSMNIGERDTIREAFINGPLWDGDVPSKTSRDSLIVDGYIEKVIVKGESGYNACTYKGAEAYRLIEAMIGKYDPTEAVQRSYVEVSSEAVN